MKFKVLGCSGSNLPGSQVTSFCVNETLLIDAGTVTSTLSLEEQARIHDICVTHSHLDHIKDILFLADNLIELVAREEHRPVRVWGLEGVLRSIQDHLLNDTIWPDFTMLPAIDTPVLTYCPLKPYANVDIGGLQVTPVPVNHARAASGYVVRGGSGKESFAFTGDTGPTDEWWSHLNALPVPVENLIIEASFPNSMEKMAGLSKHLTPELLREELEKLTYRPVVFITHMKSPFVREIRDQLRDALSGYSYHLLKQGEELDF